MLAAEDRGEVALTRTELVDRYLGMYANEDTAALAPDVRTSVDVLFERARIAGLIASGLDVQWAP
jgi:predicted solute-binding protein